MLLVISEPPSLTGQRASQASPIIDLTVAPTAFEKQGKNTRYVASRPQHQVYHRFGWLGARRNVTYEVRTS